MPTNWPHDRVSALPLHSGRAELLEEIIMSSPAVDHDRPQPSPTRRPRPWAVPLVAAASVAAIAALGVGIASGGAPDPASRTPVASGVGAADTIAAEDAGFAYLEGEDWRLEGADGDRREGEATFIRRDDASVDIQWFEASMYEDYLEDRRADGPSEPVEVLGQPAEMWSSDDHHDAMRVVVDGVSFEVSGDDMSKADFLDVLGQLVPTDYDGLTAFLGDALNAPPATQGKYDRAEMLVDDYAGPCELIAFEPTFEGGVAISGYITRDGEFVEVTAEECGLPEGPTTE